MDQPGSHPPDDLAVGKLPRFSHLKVGMHASMSKIMTNADLVMFAGISGRHQPRSLRPGLRPHYLLQGKNRPRHDRRVADLDGARHQAAGARVAITASTENRFEDL